MTQKNQHMNLWDGILIKINNMKRFDAFYARMIADTAKKNRNDQAINKRRI